MARSTKVKIIKHKTPVEMQSAHKNHAIIKKTSKKLLHIKAGQLVTQLMIFLSVLKDR